MLALVVAAAVAGPVDLARAQRDYDGARYEEALRALGPDCEPAPSPVACERLRAFVHTALGEEAGARAAFARMLTLDPFARLEADAAPKLRRLFDEVQRSVEALGAIGIEPLRAGAPDASWPLRLLPPPGVALAAVDVYLDAGGQGFERLPCALDAGVWTCAYRPPAAVLPRPRYFVEVTVAGGARIGSGTSAAPRELAVDLGEQAAAPAPGAAPLAPMTAPLAEQGARAGAVAPEPRPSGMARWGIWAIAGGATVALAAGVAAALLLDDDPGAGRIVVGIRFEE